MLFVKTVEYGVPWAIMLYIAEHHNHIPVEIISCEKSSIKIFHIRPLRILVEIICLSRGLCCYEISEQLLFVIARLANCEGDLGSFITDCLWYIAPMIGEYKTYIRTKSNWCAVSKIFYKNFCGWLFWNDLLGFMCHALGSQTKSYGMITSSMDMDQDEGSRG